MTNLLPQMFYTTIDSNGDPISGAKLNFYESGTSTPLDTYTDEALTIAHANPVIADSAGRFAPIWLAASDYKVVYTDADDVTIKTIDPVAGSIFHGRPRQARKQRGKPLKTKPSLCLCVSVVVFSTAPSKRIRAAAKSASR